MIRTTTSMIRQNWLNDTQNRLVSLDKYNRQISSGKRVEKPADDPTGLNRIIQIDEMFISNTRKPWLEGHSFICG